ncbi:MAG: hypothetical protein QF817_05975, partial [Candidatus Poseidoniaceae archaeon]|nr:hypothetical protein [Candidatus Poseidoniaceae archaeon]
MELWLDAESASGKGQIESSEFVDSIDQRIGIDIFIDEGKLLDNEGKKVINNIQTGLSSGTPLPLPPIYREVSTIWASPPKSR